MAFSRGSGSSSHQEQSFLEGQFDVFEWHPYFQSCVCYFLDHAQYDGAVQALAAYLNIQLPFQKPHRPVLSSRSAGSPSPAGGGSVLSSSKAQPVLSAAPQGIYPNATLVPYIRRLVATGFDVPAVLHGFFGDDWKSGVGPLHEQERRNFLFAAKSDNWLTVKAAYDMSEDQTVPFLRPLQGVSEKEIVAAEQGWSEWLAMQDWMLGPRAPGQGPGPNGFGKGKGAGAKKEEE
ncbi:hypothetical protein OQA88_3366 [Cercophora sp. LCS_1]